MIIIIINCALGQSSKLKIKNMHMYGWKKKKESSSWIKFICRSRVFKWYCPFINVKDKKVIFLNLRTRKSWKRSYYLKSTWTDHHSHPLLGIPLWEYRILFQKHHQSKGFPHTAHKLLPSVSESECKSKEILENLNVKKK